MSTHTYHFYSKCILGSLKHIRWREGERKRKREIKRERINKEEREKDLGMYKDWEVSNISL